MIALRLIRIAAAVIILTGATAVGAESLATPALETGARGVLDSVREATGPSISEEVVGRRLIAEGRILAEVSGLDRQGAQPGALFVSGVLEDQPAN